MSRSIRRTLLTWYAAILLVVVAAFGGFLYDHQRRTAFEKIDTQLLAHARAVAGTIEWESHGQGEEHEGFDFEETARYVRQYARGEPDAPRFLVWDGEGAVLARSKGAEAPSPLPGPGLRDRGERREIVIEGTHGSSIFVDMETTTTREDLGAFLVVVLFVGGGVLGLSLLGGWILVSRVLRPIRRMTGTASRISETNRAERIDVGRTESELGTLATTLNDAFDRLQSAYDRQTRFTADASHELRTPLSVVMANAELGLSKDRPEEDYRGALEACLRAARRMTGVVEGLLTLARSDSGEITLREEDVDLREIARETVEFLEPLAEEYGVALALGDGDPVEVRGDPDRLREAVGNLVSNGIRYNEEDGRVDVDVTVEDGRAELRVSDTGIGIPDEALGVVFERFHRVDQARSRDAGGSGLGLAIARWIVEAHGGTIELESQPGEGTTATVRLSID